MQWVASEAYSRRYTWAHSPDPKVTSQSQHYVHYIIWYHMTSHDTMWHHMRPPDITWQQVSWIHLFGKSGNLMIQVDVHVGSMTTWQYLRKMAIGHIQSSHLGGGREFPGRWCGRRWGRCVPRLALTVDSHDHQVTGRRAPPPSPSPPPGGVVAWSPWAEGKMDMWRTWPATSVE